MFFPYLHLRNVVILLSLITLTACGGGGGADGGGTDADPSAPVYTISGTVSGLAGTGLELQNNNGDDLVITDNGNFTFATAMSSGGNYQVSVKNHPTGPTQACSISGGTGVVTADITDVTVTCAAGFMLGGTVSGLSVSTGHLVLQNSDGHELTVDANGVFNFSAPVVNGTNYTVTVKTQPTNPTQLCSVNSGSGTVNGANVSNMTISCIEVYTVSATVTGLAGQGLVLQNNGVDALNVSGNGTVTFATPLAAGASYAVAVQTQPNNPKQSCSVSSGTGTVTNVDVNAVSITCVTLYTVGGTVSGLEGSGLQLRNGVELLSITTDGSFTFNAALLDGANYLVSVENNPSNPAQECTVVNADGTVSSNDITNITVNCETHDLALLAGNVDGQGGIDGTGAEARFTLPRGIATDSAGNIYVADTYNHTIRKITPEGDVTTLAGTAGAFANGDDTGAFGSADGTGADARFNLPEGIATDSAGNVYVADTNNNTIRKITPEGVVSTLAGTTDASGSADGTGAAARFDEPRGITTDRNGNIYVADTDNHTIRKITPAGVVTTIAGTARASGNTDATGANARFNNPQGIATDNAGNIYVADTNNNIIRKITPAGVVSTFAGTAGASGSTDGTGAEASFNRPRSIATDGAGNIYVADTFNRTIRKITPDGTVTTLAGTADALGSADGTGAEARFYNPQGIATDNAGNIYVADTENNTIRKITPARVVSTFAGTADVYGSADAMGAEARFHYPQGIATDNAGNVYVADTENNTIRKITPAGVVTTLAGTAGASGSADGVGAEARFSLPQGIAIDGVGNIYVADTDNHTIRKITPAGVVSTLAGTAGTSGSTDGTGAEARFNFPQGIAIDGVGNIYVADTDNHTIRKITAEGVVSTLAGTADDSGSADGTGTEARFNNPYGIAVDSTDNIYVADTYNHTIRKITPAGEVTTLAGTAGVYGSADDTGVNARFSWPIGIAIDSADNVYVADVFNNAIRKITPAGVVSTLVGVAGQVGFVPGSLPGVLAYPQGIAVYETAAHKVTLYITLNNGVVVARDF